MRRCPHVASLVEQASGARRTAHPARCTVHIARCAVHIARCAADRRERIITCAPTCADFARMGTYFQDGPGATREALSWSVATRVQLDRWEPLVAR
jgi:hypothetical protein